MNIEDKKALMVKPYLFPKGIHMSGLAQTAGKIIKAAKETKDIK